MHAKKKKKGTKERGKGMPEVRRGFWGLKNIRDRGGGGASGTAWRKKK